MQCAVIPYRRTANDDLEILLVTSRGKGNWILPKGKVKPGKSAAISAQEELYEEAGARGVIDQGPVALLAIPEATTENRAGGVVIQVFSLEVDTILLTWPEMFQRRRKWLHLRDALLAVKGAYARKALKAFEVQMTSVH